MRIPGRNSDLLAGFALGCAACALVDATLLSPAEAGTASVERPASAEFQQVPPEGRVAESMESSTGAARRSLVASEPTPSMKTNKLNITRAAAANFLAGGIAGFDREAFEMGKDGVLTDGLTARLEAILEHYKLQYSASNSLWMGESHRILNEKLRNGEDVRGFVTSAPGQTIPENASAENGEASMITGIGNITYVVYGNHDPALTALRADVDRILDITIKEILEAARSAAAGR